MNSQLMQDSTNILIIDDDPPTRKLIGNLLKEAGYRTFEASNGEEGIESLIKLCVPDLVIVDAHMPKMDGMAFLKEVRGLWNSSVLPVIVLTGDQKSETIMQFYKLGLNDFIRKPFDKNELVLRVGAQLQLARQSHAMQRFVPAEFLKVMGKENLTDLSPGDQVETEVTVLFNDIREFSENSGSEHSSENLSFVNAYLGKVVPVIRSYSGFVDKYIGDCVMALFPDGPDDAVACAADIQGVVEKYNEERLKSGLCPIKTGFGINTGNLILGVIGDERRMESTVISDAVEVASKLESLTRTFGVPSVISEVSLSRMQSFRKEDFRFLDEVTIKGKSKPVLVYEILACRPHQEIELLQSYQHLYEDACRAFRAQKYRRAMHIFAEIQDINPGDGVVCYYLGRLSAM